MVAFDGERSGLVAGTAHRHPARPFATTAQTHAGAKRVGEQFGFVLLDEVFDLIKACAVQAQESLEA